MNRAIAHEHADRALKEAAIIFCMSATVQDLLGVLRIGHETSQRGAGVSIRDALLRTRYKKLRTEFGPAELVPILRRHPHLMEGWAQYSEDKRTNGGWYLSGFDIGRVGIVDSVVSFESVERAVSEYVVRELDFWADLSGTN